MSGFQNLTNMYSRYLGLHHLCWTLSLATSADRYMLCQVRWSRPGPPGLLALALLSTCCLDLLLLLWTHLPKNKVKYLAC